MNCHYRPKSFLSTRVCPCYRYIWGKCNSFLLKKKIASGLLIGSFKIKLNGSFDPVATTRDSDLYKIFTISEVDLNGANFDGSKVYKCCGDGLMMVPRKFKMSNIVNNSKGINSA